MMPTFDARWANADPTWLTRARAAHRERLAFTPPSPVVSSLPLSGIDPRRRESRRTHCGSGRAVATTGSGPPHRRILGSLFSAHRARDDAPAPRQRWRRRRSTSARARRSRSRCGPARGRPIARSPRRVPVRTRPPASESRFPPGYAPPRGAGASAATARSQPSSRAARSTASDASDGSLESLRPPSIEMSAMTWSGAPLVRGPAGLASSIVRDWAGHPRASSCQAISCAMTPPADHPTRCTGRPSVPIEATWIAASSERLPTASRPSTNGERNPSVSTPCRPFASPT
jgi:hypothetical protein